MVYEGHNGQISIDGDVLVITRSGLAARAAFGKGVPPRRLPLRAVSGVRLHAASRLANGWLQLLLGGIDQPPPTVGTAASNPDAVIFTHAKRDSFAELYTWLMTVVDYNQSHVIDSAAVPFDPGQSRQLPSAAELERRAAQDSERAKRDMELYGAGGERPDIAEAAGRMGWKFGGKRELKKLSEHLHASEAVRFIAQGTYERDEGIVVLTDQRLVFVFHGIMRQSVEDFPIDRISSVSSKAGLVTGQLVVHASGNVAAISGIVKPDLTFLVNALRQRLAEGPGTSAAAAPPDVMDQLRKLAELRDIGGVTPAEFETAKSELLKRV